MGDIVVREGNGHVDVSLEMTAFPVRTTLVSCWVKGGWRRRTARSSDDVSPLSLNLNMAA